MSECKFMYYSAKLSFGYRMDEKEMLKNIG